MRYAALCLILVGCAGAPATTPKAVHADDPWPECKQVRQWFAENLGEPQSLEIVKWESKNDWKYPDDGETPAGCFWIKFKYRARNKYGALEVKDARAHFTEFKLNAVNDDER